MVGRMVWIAQPIRKGWTYDPNGYTGRVSGTIGRVHTRRLLCGGHVVWAVAVTVLVPLASVVLVVAVAVWRWRHN